MSKKATETNEPAASTETPAPPATETETPESAATEEPIVKSGFKKVRVAEMRGSFGNAKFNDDCEAEISYETFELLRKHFPEANIEVLD